MSNTPVSPADRDPADGVPPESTSSFRTGTIALCGRPNVGKSTLLNRLIGAKLSITSRKAQTTRHRITGIVTTDAAQYVFVDTPGYQTRHRNALNRSMNRAVQTALADVDVVLFVVDATRYADEDRAVQALLPRNVPVILVVNKADLLRDKGELLPYLQARSAEFDYAAIVPVSAETGLQTAELLTEIARHLPLAEAMFAADELTDRNERFLAAEMVREKIFRLSGDELPYGTTVQIDKFESQAASEIEVAGKAGQSAQAQGGSEAQRRIYATILVERDSHKAMLIGAGGEKLKRIGTEARHDMEKMFGGRVYLELWVKVKSGWADDEAALKGYGYE